MKYFYSILLLIFSICITYSCGNQKSVKNDTQSENDTITVPDTGYTGIKQYMSGQLLVKEVTFRNGVREGLMKSFYADGRLRMTYWYKNGLREDSAKWYYPEGQLFRSTPYKRDTVDGTQKQYYRSGKVKAILKYVKGLRTPYLEEFTQDGRLIKSYPSLIINVKDDYRTKGVYNITLSLSDKSTKVKFFRGDISRGVFDTAHCKAINTIKGVGSLNLKKTGSSKPEYIGIIAEVLTNFGNNYLIFKKVDLPYNDLN